MPPQLIDLGNPVADHPLNLGLVAWWLSLPNNSGGTRLFDITGHGNTGTLTAGPTWRTGLPVWGPGFSSLKFVTGSSQYVDCGNAPVLQITGNMSVSAWVYLASNSDTNGRMIIAKDNNTGGRAYTFDVRNNGSVNLVRFYINGGS